MNTKLDVNQVIKNVFNEAEETLNVSLVAGTPSADVESNLDMEQILKAVYDPDTQTLRVINKV